MLSLCATQGVARQLAARAALRLAPLYSADIPPRLARRELATSSTVAVEASDAEGSSSTQRDGPGKGNPAIKPALKLNLYGLNREGLASLLANRYGAPAYRAKQLHEWLYTKKASSFGEMLNLPSNLRAHLDAEAAIGGALRLVQEQVSKDGTRKRAYALHDGSVIESVLMCYRDGRRTACISSQAGCAMRCSFCATGQSGFKRQLSAEEIFEQVLLLSRDLERAGERLSNVVFMGMGEPLANFRNVMAAVDRMNIDLGIGARHITISTVGVAPKILKLAEANPQVGLAVSLHSPFDDERSAMMPVNDRYPIGKLMDACAQYVAKTHRHVTFAYALIAGKNDTEECALELARLLGPLHPMCHVNVIPLNPTRGFAGRGSREAAVARFAETVERHSGVRVTVRVRRGIDIDAGCGQLAAKVEGGGGGGGGVSAE